MSARPEDKGNYVAKAINKHGEAKAFTRLVVKSLGDFKKNEELIRMEEKLIRPTFKEIFKDRRVPEGISTKFECIVYGKPCPKVYCICFFKDTILYKTCFKKSNSLFL